MHLNAVLSSLRRGTPLAAPIQSSDSARLAFVGVYPLDLSSALTKELLRNRGLALFPSEGRAYHIRAFEVERRLIEADATICEADLTNQTSSIAFSEDELSRQLEAVGVAIESLEFHYKSDYPI